MTYALATINPHYAARLRPRNQRGAGSAIHCCEHLRRATEPFVGQRLKTVNHVL